MWYSLCSKCWHRQGAFSRCLHLAGVCSFFVIMRRFSNISFYLCMIRSVGDFQHPFFIGIAGSGMSAIAQYLKGNGKNVSGSDRFFIADQPNETREKLEAEGIPCFPQDGSGITGDTDLIVVSSAIEDTVPEVQKARQMGIRFLKRSELLALIAASKKTIAVAGTSGKSTTSAMLFDILELAGMEPSIISGAGRGARRRPRLP